MNTLQPFIKYSMTLFRLTTAAAADARGDAAPPRPSQSKAPRILIDQPERQVEYQLGRLTSEQLVDVERKDDDPKYRPVYRAILSRSGVPPQFRDEAVAALVKLDKSTPARVLLTGLAKIAGDDEVTGESASSECCSR